MKLFTVPLAAAAIALTVAPALAQYPRTHYHPYGHSYPYYPGWQGGGWINRPVGGWVGPGAVGGWGAINRPFSDPSNVSPGYLRERALGRCVEDLGYGRYEYC